MKEGSPMQTAILKAETTETLRQLSWILMLFTLVPALYLLDNSLYRSGVTLMEYLSNGMDLFILVSAASLAYNMFDREERDGATEYLLSLPTGRWKLLAAKVIPRAAALLPLLAAGMILNALRMNQGSALGMILIRWRAGILYLWGFALFTQLCGFLMGISGRRSWPVRLFLLVMAFCVWRFASVTLLAERLVLWTMGREAQMRFAFRLAASGGRIFDLALFFLLLASVLRPLMRRWDVRPRRETERLFVRYASLPMLLFCLMLLNRFAGGVRPILL